jgi:hypothetical protein
MKLPCLLCLLFVSRRFLAWLVLQHWRRKRHVSPKGRLIFNGIHCAISQTTRFFITTAVRTSNPTFLYEECYKLKGFVHSKTIFKTGFETYKKFLHLLYRVIWEIHNLYYLKSKLGPKSIVWCLKGIWRCITFKHLELQWCKDDGA